MENEETTIEIKVEDAPRQEASIILEELRTYIRDRFPDATVERKPEPGALDVGVLMVIATHASVVLMFQVLEAWWDQNNSRRLGRIKLSDKDVEFFLDEEGKERLAKWLHESIHKKKTDQSI